MTNRWRISTSSAAWPDNFIHFHDLTDTPPDDPDRDHDGVPNGSDGCPDTPGPAWNGGCPVAAPAQLLRNASFESGFNSWMRINQADSVNFAGYSNTSIAHDGPGYAEFNSSAANGSVGQDVSLNFGAGDSFSFSVWLRAAPGTASYSGHITLHGLGVSAHEASDTSFTVGNVWTLVTVPLDAGAAHDQLRAEIYMNSSGSLDADGAQLARVGLHNASFESGFNGWMRINQADSVNFAGYSNPGYAHDGPGYAEMNSSAADGSVGQDLSVAVAPGDSFSFSVWLRAAPGTDPYSGHITLHGLGVSAHESSDTSFTVGNAWTLVTVPLDAGAAHDQLRAEIYMNSSGSLDADGAQVMRTVLRNASFESGFNSWMRIYQADSVNFAGYSNAAYAHDGPGYAEMNSSAANGSVGQDVSVAVAAGDSYAFSVWLRASPGTGTYSGHVTLHGLGVSANESTDTPFTVGEQWTLVTAPLDAGSAHSQLRAEIYMNSGGNLDADGATLVAGGARTGTAPLLIDQPELPTLTVGEAWSTGLTSTGGTAPYVWTVESGELPAGLSLSADGTISGTPTTAGTSSAVVAVTDTSVPRNVVTRSIQITVTDPLRVATASLGVGVLSTPYSSTLAALGAAGATTWSLTSGSLPPGLRMTRAGVLSGRPTSVGTFRFVVQVADSATPASTATKALSIRIDGIAIGTSALAAGVVGKPFAATLSSIGGVGVKSWTVKSGALPGGMTLSSDGRLSGTPTGAGTFRFAIAVTDSASPTNTASRSFQVVVAPIAIRTTTLKAGTVGRSYVQSLLAWGGTAPLTWRVVDGTVPSGLTLGSTGVLSGKPTAAGTYTFTVRVLDAKRKAATASLSVTIT